MLVLLPALKISQRRVEQGSKPGVGTHTLRGEGFYVTHIARCFHVNCINRTVKLKLPGYWTQIPASRSCVLLSLNPRDRRAASKKLVEFPSLLSFLSLAKQVHHLAMPLIQGSVIAGGAEVTGRNAALPRARDEAAHVCGPAPPGAVRAGLSPALPRGEWGSWASPPDPLSPSSPQVPFSKAMLPRTMKCSSRRCRI